MTERGQEKFDALCNMVMETFWSVFPYLSRSSQFSEFGPAEQQKLATVYGIGLTYLFAQDVEPQFQEILPETPNHAAFTSLDEYCQPVWGQMDKLSPEADVRRQDPVAVWVVQVLLGGADERHQFEINALCHFYEIALKYLKKRWNNEPLVEDPRNWQTRERELEVRLEGLPADAVGVTQLPEGLYLLKSGSRTVLLAEAKVLAIYQTNGIFISGWSHPTIFAAARPDPVMGLPAEFANPISEDEAQDWASQYADRLGVDYLVAAPNGELTVFLGLSNLREPDSNSDAEPATNAVLNSLSELVELVSRAGADRATLADTFATAANKLSRIGQADYPNTETGSALERTAGLLKEISEEVRPNSQLVTATPPILTPGVAEDLHQRLTAECESWSGK